MGVKRMKTRNETKKVRAKIIDRRKPQESLEHYSGKYLMSKTVS
jgi:hypothetical protein